MVLGFLASSRQYTSGGYEWHLSLFFFFFFNVVFDAGRGEIHSA